MGASQPVLGTLDGKIALVTGASRGIGRGIATALAEAGADLALCARDAEKLAETAEVVTNTGRNAECVVADVGDSGSVAEAVVRTLEVFGRIDVLVNNAGVTDDNLLIRMTDDEWERVIHTNLTGTYLFMRAVTKPMMKQRSGSIINIASIIGIMGNAGQSNYAASKGGIIALTKSVAKELASRNVRANAIAPGYIETDMTEELTDEVKQKMREAIPMKSFGVPADVAAVAVFLAGDASRYITGEVINVSGGLLI
jgi:3-oxoacyl-[acyl-carrier protein] reductase